MRPFHTIPKSKRDELYEQIKKLINRHGLPVKPEVIFVIGDIIVDLRNEDTTR